MHTRMNIDMIIANKHNKDKVNWWTTWTQSAEQGVHEGVNLVSVDFWCIEKLRNTQRK